MRFTAMVYATIIVHLSIIVSNKKRLFLGRRFYIAMVNRISDTVGVVLPVTAQHLKIMVFGTYNLSEANPRHYTFLTSHIAINSF